MIWILLCAALADQIAAQVGSEVILESDVAAGVAFLSGDPMAMQMLEPGTDIRDHVRDELINRRLLVNLADAESIFIADEEIQGQVERAIENVKARFPTEADFAQALQEQGLTVDDLRQNYRETIKPNLIMQRVVEKKLASKVVVSPVAVRDFYQTHKDSIGTVPGRVKLAHILLPIRPSDTELRTGFERALEVYKLLLSGAEFAIIAQEFSQDENTRRKGGMLGRIRRGESIEEFEAALFAQKPGIISQPFPTRLGYHIVEVLNKGEDWVLARQILITVKITRSDTARTENLARSIKAKVESGVAFDSLAQVHSQDPNTDLGEFYIDQLTPPFDTVVARLDSGQVSEPILTAYGYHLLYARTKTPEKVLTFDELRDQIYQYLYQQEMQKHYDRLIAELRSKTYVKVFAQ